MAFFAQISDPHLVPPGRTLDGVDTVAALVERIDRINALPVPPACVIASGDLVDDGSVAAYRHLAAHLARLAVPVHLLPGNHDDRDAMRQVFGDALGTRGAIQCVVELGDWRVLGLDTLDAGRESGWLCIDRLDWLHDRLSESALPTLIVLHHPPFASGIPGMDGMGLRNPDALAEVLAEHAHVLGVSCGHVHRAVFTSWAGRPATICPGAAHQIHFDPRATARLAWTTEPGGLLLHEFAGGAWRAQVLAGPAPEPRPYAD